MEALEALVQKTLNTFQTSERTCKPYDPIEVMNNAEGSLTGYNCPKCKNKGVIYYAKDGYEFFKECECMKVRESIRRIEKSGLKETLEKSTFKNFEIDMDFQKTMVAKAKGFLKDYQNNWFFIGGQVGCGKTHICTAIVRKLLVGEGKNTRYLQWRDEVPKIKAKANSDEYEKLIEPWKTVEVLYIDDLFKTGKGKDEQEEQKPTAADINVAFEIINYRYRNPALITIISSQSEIKGLVGIDEAVGSRIFEKSRNYCINISKDIKKNYRLKSMF